MKQPKREENNPHQKLHFLMNIILAIIFVIVIGSIILFHLQGDDSEGIFNDPNYSFEIIDNNKVVLFNEGIKISEFHCYDICDIYTENNQGYFYNGRILLQDGEVFFLYDLLNEQKLSDEFDEVAFILDNEGNIRLFKVTNDNQSGIMNLMGNMQVELIYNQLGNIGEDGYLTNYSFERGYITALRGDLWGKISLENGRGMIDFQYQDIIISDYNMLAVKDDNLWYLVDAANIRIINDGFDSIIIHENLIVVALNNQAYIINLEGKPISNKINLSLPVNPWLFNTPENGLYTIFEDNHLYLLVGDGVNQIRYRYDGEELIKI